MKLPIIVAATAVLAGCANTPTPNYDRKFGEAVRNARQAMTINPNAGTAGGPVAGMGGPAAHEAAGRYQDSFRKPPPVVNVINIGGSVSGQSGGR